MTSSSPWRTSTRWMRNSLRHVSMRHIRRSAAGQAVLEESQARLQAGNVVAQGFDPLAERVDLVAGPHAVGLVLRVLGEVPAEAPARFESPAPEMPGELADLVRHDVADDGGQLFYEVGAAVEEQLLEPPREVGVARELAR